MANHTVVVSMIRGEEIQLKFQGCKFMIDHGNDPSLVWAGKAMCKL